MKEKEIPIYTRLLVTIIVAFIYGIFFKAIVESHSFYAMGTSGIAVISSRLLYKVMPSLSTSMLYMIIYLTLNIPLFLFAYKKISKRFVTTTLAFTLSFSLTIGLMPLSFINKLGLQSLDPLTSAILIGIVGGFCCAMSFRMGGSAGGLDIIATYLNVKKGKSIGTYILVMNTTILFLGLIIDNNVSILVYTLFYSFFCSLVLDKYYNRNKKVLLEIITSEQEKICNKLMEIGHHGCTVMKASGAYTHMDKFVIHTAISAFQEKKIRNLIKEIDDKSFVISFIIESVDGKFYMPPIK